MLASLAVGVLAGLLVAHLRLHLRLPGHKMLFWMTPIVAGRLLLGHPLGATAGASAAALTALAMGGHLAGGILFLPLVVLAGGLLDAAAALAQRRRLGPWPRAALLASAALGGGLICAAKRLLAPAGNWHVVLGIGDPAASVMCYAAFSLAAGLAGALIATGALGLARRRRGAN
jgi:hypothetical protein